MAAASRPAGPLRRNAWAKVNLTLHVTGRRPDGYHELDSLIVFAGVGDELEIQASGELTLAIEGPFSAALSGPSGRGEAVAPAPPNLVMRAAEALRARYGVKAGARLRLIKRLPVAAGIGGGSSDAAAALVGLSQLWDLDAAPAELAALGAELGADVPVCLAARPSFVSGIGERIAPAPALPPAWLVLVNPRVPLATAAVFKAWSGARTGPFSEALRWADALADPRDLAARLAEGRNDLEAAARALVPEVGQVLAALGRTPDCLLARMSGSGATCFGLYSGRAVAEAAATAIQAYRPAWWGGAAPILNHVD